VANRLLKEIINRLEYIDKVGLGYLTLNRPERRGDGAPVRAETVAMQDYQLHEALNLLRGLRIMQDRR
jgi:hypothetical protein